VLIKSFVEEFKEKGEPISSYNMGLSTTDDPFHNEAAMATTLAALGYKIPAELYSFLPKDTQDRRPQGRIFLTPLAPPVEVGRMGGRKPFPFFPFLTPNICRHEQCHTEKTDSGKRAPAYHSV